MALLDIESAKQKMLQAQEALLRYAEAVDRDPSRHNQLIQDLHKATRDFVDRVEQLSHASLS